MNKWIISAIASSILLQGLLFAQTPATQPNTPEPELGDVLRKCWQLDEQRDLRNPPLDGASPAALFQRINRKKAVTVTPLVALGMADRTQLGWYEAGPQAGDLPEKPDEARHLLWSIQFKQPDGEYEDLKFTAPPIEHGDTKFDPADKTFGLWVASDHFNDAGVYTQPKLVARQNQRLRDQPYKVKIYPMTTDNGEKLNRDSYLLCWEYSTNDDFQDLIVRIDNVRLLPGDPALPGIVAAEAKVEKLADGFTFVEGPAWDFKNGGLYFSDIPRELILCYREGQAHIVNRKSGRANGLMFDRDGRLVACEGAGENGRRRISRGKPDKAGETVTAFYEGKRYNSPNDLWIDATGGIYFTDPRYGDRKDMELKVEAVYYAAADGQVRRIIDDLVRPNGIALSPDGQRLYVVDNAADRLHCYPIEKPGHIGSREWTARVTFPDGMTVDRAGRLYVSCIDGIWILDQKGNWIGRIDTPQQPTNCTFGGKDYNTLFITAQTGLYAIETQTRGRHVHLDGRAKKDEK